jgi:hypothetical protein
VCKAGLATEAYGTKRILFLAIGTGSSQFGPEGIRFKSEPGNEKRARGLPEGPVGFKFVLTAYEFPFIFDYVVRIIGY